MNLTTSTRTLVIVGSVLAALAGCDRKPADLPPEQRSSGGQNSIGSGGAPSITGGAYEGPSASSGGAVTPPSNNPTPGFAGSSGTASPGTSSSTSPSTSPGASTAADASSPTTSSPPAGIAGGSGTATASETDRSFVTAATKSGLVEVAAARFVAAESKDPQVKSFAEQLQQEHSEANARLAQLAQARNIPADAAAAEAGDPDLVELQKAPPEKIDALFISRFGTIAHQDAIALFERQARDGMDPDLRRFANDMLPALRRHQEAARALEQKLAGGTR